MRDLLLATAMLGGGVGLSTGCSRIRAAQTCSVALASFVIATSITRADISDRILVASWILIACSAALCWLPRDRAPHALRMLLSMACGAVAGGFNHRLLSTAGLVFAASLLSLTLGAVILAAKKWILPMRIAAGWLVAIATLNVSLTIIPVTPGYLPDHLE